MSSSEPWRDDAEKVLRDITALHDSNRGIKPLGTDEQTEIHVRVHLRVTRIADYRCRRLSRDERQEVVQTVMTRLLRDDVIEMMAGRGSAPYIARMLRNAEIDVLRRRQKEQRWMEQLDEKTLKVVIEQPPEMRLALHQAMKSLTAEDAEVLYLRFWMGLKIDEIADTLRISFSAAAKRLPRAIAKLRRILGVTE